MHSQNKKEEKYWDVEVRDAQLIMLEALKEIDRICKKHKLIYWLDSGTLLGAKRHKGFIPWDDDLDICMERESYEQFLELVENKEKNELFFTQTVNSDPNYRARAFLPCKFRVKGTELIEEKDYSNGKNVYNFHDGFFVDIFPFDKYPKNKFKSFCWKFSGRYLIPKKARLIRFKTKDSRVRGGVYKKLEAKLVDYLFSWDYLDKKTKATISKSKKIKTYNWGYGMEMPFMKYPNHEEKTMFPLKEIEFEGLQFSAPKDTEKYLTGLYGANYMQLPPEKDRKWHAKSLKVNEEWYSFLEKKRAGSK